MTKLRTGRYQADLPDVLVIDDDVDVRWSLIEVLQENGFVAIGAANGAEGSALAAQRSPRLILLDLRMPVMDGWQFLERRRESSELARIPVAVISAEHAQLPSGAQVNAALGKPVSEEQLLAVVVDLLRADDAGARHG